MKKFQAWVYECEHCGKRCRSGGHMRSHEDHCTLNPNRHCRVCDLLEQEKPDLAALRAIIAGFGPTECEWRPGSLEIYDTEREDALIAQLRTASGGCPACMLSALRFERTYLSVFNYRSEMDEVFKDVNESRREGWAY